MRHVWQNLRGNYVLGIKEIYETLGCLASKNINQEFFELLVDQECLAFI